MQPCDSSNTNKNLAPLFDLDLLRFRCGFAADSQMMAEAKAYDPDASAEELQQMLESADYLDKALQNVKTVIQAVNDRFDESRASYYIDGAHNFRYDVATIKPYKGNRDKTHKPKYFDDIKTYVLDVWKAEEVENIETDDRLGIIQYNAEPNSTVIVSVDKDMLQIPGYHFNWVKGELQYVSPDDGDLMFFWQMMVGDTSDNIPGINKIGPKTADKIIAECAYDVCKVRDAVQVLYQKQYGENWRQAYNEVGTLLYIHRNEADLNTGPPLL